MSGTVQIGGLTAGASHAPLLIAGPCVIESADAVLSLADAIRRVPAVSHFQFVFKASYLKDNRSSAESFRGPGLEEGLRILERVRAEIDCPVTSDVHAPGEVPAAAEVLDLLQVPAFLSRQTSLLEAVAACGKPVNVKKAQFMAPEDMGNVVRKLSDAPGVLLTERGTSFGYHNLVVDFRGFSKMKATGCPVIFDVTHSLQRPGGLGKTSGGEPELAGDMARAAAAVGVDGFFIETHPDPSRALSDAASMLPLDRLDRLLESVWRVGEAAREQ